MTIVSLKRVLSASAILVTLSAHCYTFKWGLSARQGDRPTMEDAHTHITAFKGNANAAFFGVYDGHSGPRAAAMACKNLHKHLDPASADNAQQQLGHAFAQTEKDICAQTSSGSCAVVAYIHDNNAHIAWTGDSRAVVVRNGSVIFATQDHKPDNPRSQKRIEQAGGEVTYAGVPRVSNLLAVSRALGDRSVKQRIPGAVIAIPEMYELSLQKGDTIILACDGIWDVLSNEQAAQVVSAARAMPVEALVAQYPEKPRVRYGKSDKHIEEDGNDTQLQLMARALRDSAYNKRSTDNLSVQIIEVQ